MKKGWMLAVALSGALLVAGGVVADGGAAIVALGRSAAPFPWSLRWSLHWSVANADEAKAASGVAGAKSTDDAKPETAKEGAKKEAPAKEGEAGKAAAEEKEAGAKKEKKKEKEAGGDKPAGGAKAEGAVKAEGAAKEPPAAIPADAKAAAADAPVEVKLGGAVEKKDGVAAEKDKAKATAKKEPAADKKKKDVGPPMFRLRDGTRLAGTPSLQDIHVATAYGKLTVPVPEVVRVRFAAAEDTQTATKVAAEVQALGSEEFDRREEAMTALRQIGAPALDALKKAAESEDEEVKSRAEKLLSELEESLDEAEGEEAILGPIAGDEDEVVTVKFTVRGKIEERTFSLATRYGALSLSRDAIVSVVFQETANTKVPFSIPGTTFAGDNKWVDTKLAFASGEQVRITAQGQINMEQFGQATGPEGTTNVSGQFESFPGGALVGRIGDKGKPFLIGSDYDGAANGAGSLFLGVALKNGQVSGGYQVEVEKEGES
ncbi:MAG TPA: hypothetical protein VFD71_00845 [Planctomycetota bacterium]|nr:hypothetical protein [Planctomycetota bacterium]